MSEQAYVVKLGILDSNRRDRSLHTRTDCQTVTMADPEDLRPATEDERRSLSRCGHCWMDPDRDDGALSYYHQRIADWQEVQG